MLNLRTQRNFINKRFTSLEANIVTDSFQILRCKLFVEGERLEACQPSLLLAVFSECFGLVETDVRVGTQLFHAGVIQVDVADIGRVDAEPVVQLPIVKVDFFQLFYAVEAA